MVFNFKKIASVVSSGLMMSATLALAAAANYPAPFVQNGNADVAIVVGESAAFSDNSAATALSTDLATVFAAQGGQSTGSTTITGENFPLFTSSTELRLNASLNEIFRLYWPMISFQVMLMRTIRRLLLFQVTAEFYLVKNLPLTMMPRFSLTWEQARQMLFTTQLSLSIRR